MMNECCRVKIELPSLLSKEVTHFEAAIIRQHLARCSSCRVEATQLEWVIALLIQVAEFENRHRQLE